MRKLLGAVFLFIPLAFFAQKKKEVPVKYWEELHDTAKLRLKGEKFINKNALLYLEGKFIPTDDSISQRMILDITMPTESGLPLNFFVFNSIVRQHEKELVPLMGAFCRRMIQSHPDYTLIWLYQQKEKKSELWKTYAKYLGEQCSDIEYRNLKNFLEFYYATGGKAAAKQMSAALLKEADKHRKK